MINGTDNDLLMERGIFDSNRIIQVGLIDATDNTIEDEEETRDFMIKLSAYHDPGLIWVAPNSGMRGLNRDSAFEKLEVLHRAVIMARRELARREEPGGSVEF